MSNALAIAEVTRALKDRLDENKVELTQAAPPLAPDPAKPMLTLARVTLTADSPDRIATERKDATKQVNQVNLFLYQTAPNAAWRNTDVPGQVRPGETGTPPLPLNLFYFLTAYGAGDNELLAHALLGWAMRVLHDFPLLEPKVIGQAERVRITLQPLSSEEVSKLWTIFQAPYRVSAAYQVAVVLIDSTRPPKAPLPVLKRGEDDRGVRTQPDPLPPFPELEAAFAQKAAGPFLPPDRLGRQPAVRVGEALTLRGRNLDGKAIQADDVKVRLKLLGKDEGIELTPTFLSKKEIRVTLDAGRPWVVGFYTATCVYRKANPAQETTANQLPVALAPGNVAVVRKQVQGDGGDKFTVTLDLVCVPNIDPSQTAVLLLGDLAVPARKRTAINEVLRFVAAHVPRGDHFLRLRVDGVDSSIVADYDAPNLQLDPNQKVAVP